MSIEIYSGIARFIPNQPLRKGRESWPLWARSATCCGPIGSRLARRGWGCGLWRGCGQCSGQWAGPPAHRTTCGDVVCLRFWRTAWYLV